MAKITDLAEQTSPAESDVIPVAGGDGVAKKLSLATLLAWVAESGNLSDNTAGIPADVVTEANRTASSMISKMGSNAVTFIAMTDMHEMGDNDHSDAAVIERYRRANLNAGQAARLISDKVPLDLFVNLGDFAYGANNASLVTSYHDLMQSIAAGQVYTASVKADERIELPGNHDPLFDITDSSGSFITNDLITGMIGGYRYVDLTEKKVRVIALHTAEYVSGHSRSVGRMSGEQLQWFAESLDLSAKSDAAEWGIILLSHHPLDWSGLENAVGVLKAYLAGSSFFATHNGVAVSKNFSGKNAAAVIAQFHGHVHCLKVGYIGDTSVCRMAIPNACFGRNNEYGQEGNYTFGEETRCLKYDDSTGRNTAFCLVSIDLAKKIIYADCFGSLGATEPGINAGYDRTISYGSSEVITYKVTNNLTNASNSNGAGSITEGAAYTATISANSGYELESVTVTMGGADITSSAVSGGNISISKVTGDVVITATAAESSGGDEPIVYTNLVPTSLSPLGTGVYNGIGYKNGAYVTGINDGGTDSVCVATGLILLDSSVETIYIKGAAWDTSNGHVRFYTVSSVGASSCSHQVKADGSGANQLSGFFDVEELGTSYYKWTLNANGKSALRGKYYCLSLVGTGENLIISHNQPIA